MPFALVAALIASLGVHAAALFLPDVEPVAPAAATSPPSVDVVLRPRASPVPAQEPPARAARRQLPAPKAIPKTVPEALPGTASASAMPSGDGAETPLAGQALLPAPPVGGGSSDGLVPALEDSVEAIESAETAAATAPLETAGTAGTAGLAEAPPPVTSPELPANGEIRYVVQRGDPPLLIGTAVHRWQMGEGRYRIESVMETSGLAALVRAVRVETESSGRLVVDGLLPEHYLSRRIERGRSREERVDFDHAAGLARFAAGSTAPLPAGTQDLLSFNYQLGWLARTGEMSIATGRRIGVHWLELLGREWLETPARPIWTLHFRATGETTTEVWLAPDEYLLPVKILHIDKKGERFEQVLEAIRLDPPPDGAPE